MPEELIDQLRLAAERNGRTLAAEIIERLEASFPKHVDLVLLESRHREMREKDMDRMHLVRVISQSGQDPESRRRAQEELVRVDMELMRLNREILQIYKRIPLKEPAD